MYKTKNSLYIVENYVINKILGIIKYSYLYISIIIDSCNISAYVGNLNIRFNIILN